MICKERYSVNACRDLHKACRDAHNNMTVYIYSDFVRVPLQSLRSVLERGLLKSCDMARLQMSKFKVVWVSK